MGPLVILSGTAAAGDEGGAEQQATADQDANNSNSDVVDKPTSPSGQSQNADDVAAAVADTHADGEFSVL